MGDGKWFRRGGRRAKSEQRQREGKAKRKGWLSSAANRCALSFESLEDRRLLTTFLVSNTNDLDGDGNIILGSLRWAVQQANTTGGADTIVFSDNIFSELGAFGGYNQEQFEQDVVADEDFGFSGTQTIRLSSIDSPNSGALNITESVEILGPGYKRIIVSQNKPDSRVFNIIIGADDVAFPVEISGITIESGSILGDGEDDKGGGVFNREALTMREVRIRDNSASMGGGGVYTKFGSLNLWRSVVEGNSGGGQGGGGILNGADDDDARPTTRVVNSTVHNNNGGEFGGGILNRNGTLIIQSSTITDNTANAMMNGGEGVASWGNPLPDDPANPPPPKTVFTFSSNSIIFGNGASDFDRVGKSDDDPPVDLLPSVESRGFNIVGTGNTTDAASPDVAFEAANDDQIGVDPLLIEFGNFGGSVDTYILDPTSPAIDAGDPAYFQFGFQGTKFDARGRHFTRIFNFTDPSDPDAAVVDIGATEMQAGVFVVDTLVDEFDFSSVELFFLEFVSGLPQFTIFDYGDFESTPSPEPGEPPSGFRLGDLSLREALDYAARNPGKDTIQFSPVLNELDALAEEDTDSTPAPTIVLNRAITYTRPFGQTFASPHRPAEGSLKVRASDLDPLVYPLPADDGYLDIEGPQGFILEIDSRGNDLNPNVASGGGSRVFLIDDFDNANSLEISMENVTIMGGDVFGDGGGILSRENLTLIGTTFKNNNATDDGGALFIVDGTVLIDRSTFNNNRAGDNGGAIDVFSGDDLTITSSTFSANVANNRGGAIYNENSKLVVEFSTLTLNSAGSLKGSGIANVNTNATADVETQVRGSIISKNVSNADVDFIATATNSATAASFDSNGYNFIGMGSAKASFNKPGDLINQTEPLLEQLLNTGGLVETHRPTYNPAAGQISPVIDAGDPLATGAPMFDQRGEGFDRVKDGNFDAVARIDIGSYELQGITLTVTNPDDENDGVVTPGNLSLREAIQLSNLNPFADLILFDQQMIADLILFQNNDPTLFLGDSTTVPGTPADLRITGSLIIDAEGQQLAIDGEQLDNPSQTINGSRMFTVNDGNSAVHSEVVIRGLEFRNARAPQAGSVFWSNENLTIEDSRFINNLTRDEMATLTGLHGGAIYQEGAAGLSDKPLLKLVRSEFTSNSTQDVGADGGAVYVTNAELILEDSSLAGNSTGMANSEGGALAVLNGIFTSSFSSITGNFTGGGSSDGGGFFAESSIVTLNNTTVSGNETDAANSDGAGFAGLNSDVTLNDSIVSFNTAHGSQSRGGGIYMLHSGAVGAISELELNRSEVRQNRAEGISALGGGIAISGGSATIRQSAVSANRVVGGGGHGGGIANLGGTLVVRDSAVYDNTAEDSQSKGGGVYSDTNLTGSQSTLILNATVSGNSAGSRGGGVYNADGLTTIKHSTISNNATPVINTGSGVASFANAATTKTIVFSSIIAGNVGVAAGTRTDVDSVDGSFANTIQSGDNVPPPGTPRSGFNVVGTGNSVGSFNQLGDKSGVLNPGLAALADNGSPGSLPFEFPTHALLSNSAAINAGDTGFNPFVYSPALSTDQRGSFRVQFGRIDIGAFEANLPSPLQADFDGDSDVDGSDFLTWQRNLGRTNATKAQGDATGNGVVNGDDLAAWRANFGVGATGGAAAVAASSSAAVFVSAAVQAAPDAVSEAGLPSSKVDLSPLASSGTPGSSAAAADSGYAAADEDYYFAAASLSPTTTSWSAASGYSSLHDFSDSDFDLLVAAGNGDPEGEAEDAVFAAWGEELFL